MDTEPKGTADEQEVEDWLNADDDTEETETTEETEETKSGDVGDVAEDSDEQEEESAEEYDSDALAAEVAELRLQLTKEKERARAADEKIVRYRKAAAQYGYTGDDGDIADRMIADHRGVDAGEVAREREAEEAARMSDPDYAEFVRWREERSNEAVFAADLMAIKAAHPEVTAASIGEIPNFDKFAELRSKNISATDAYRLANFDEITAARKAAAKQQALNSGKDHLKRMGGAAGDAGADIPPDILKDYRGFGFSDKEAIADYKKHMKKESV